MANKQYLSNQLKHELIMYLGEKGRNYDSYLQWCSIRGVKPFSKFYLNTWMQRRQSKIQWAREVALERVQRLSQYDRDRRIGELEDAIAVINSYLSSPDVEPHQCAKCERLHSAESPKDVIALMEQKRKLLEAVAKERGEWLKSFGAESASVIDNPAEKLKLELVNAYKELREGLQSSERVQSVGTVDESVRGPLLLLSEEGSPEEQVDERAPSSEE